MSSLPPLLFVSGVILVFCHLAGRKFADGPEAVFLGMGIVATASLPVFTATGVNHGSQGIISGLVLLTIFLRRSVPSGDHPVEPLSPAWERAFCVLALAGISLALAYAAAPMVFIDTLHYHIGIPWQYVIEGRLAGSPYDIVSAYPEINEMLLTHFLLLKFDARAGAVLNIMILLAFAFEFTGRRKSFLPAALLLTTPFVLQTAVLGKNDILNLVFVYYAWKNLARRAGLRSALQGGVFLGLAFATKYTSALFLPAFLLLALIRDDIPSPAARIRTMLGVLGCAILVMAPWLIRNLLHHGNPVYPFLSSFFSGNTFSTGTAVPEWPHDPWTAFARIILLGRGDRPLMNTAGFHYLAGLGMMIFHWRKISRPIPYLVFLVPTVIVWSAISPHPRFIMPVFLLMNMVIVEALTKFRYAVPMLVVLFGCMTVNLGMTIHEEETVFHRSDYLGGEITGEQYLRAFVPIVELQRRIPAGDDKKAIVLVGETSRTYFLNPVIVTGYAERHFLEDRLSRSGDAEQLAGRLRSEGVGYVYVDRDWWRLYRTAYGYFSPPKPQEEIFSTFLETECDVVASAGSATLYRISSSADSEPAAGGSP